MNQARFTFPGESHLQPAPESNGRCETHYPSQTPNLLGDGQYCSPDALWPSTRRCPCTASFFSGCGRLHVWPTPLTLSTFVAHHTHWSRLHGPFGPVACHLDGEKMSVPCRLTGQSGRLSTRPLRSRSPQKPQIHSSICAAVRFWAFTQLLQNHSSHLSQPIIFVSDFTLPAAVRSLSTWVPHTQNV